MAWINDRDCGLVISIFRIESYSTAKAAAHGTVDKRGEAVCVRECVRVGVCSVCGVVQLWHCVLALCA